MRNLLRWLTPGMGVKRWIFTALAGLVLCNGGAVLITYVLVREWRGRPSDPTWIVVGSLLVGCGLFLGAYGARRLIWAVARALHPAPPRLLDAFYRSRTRFGPKLVAIGGGTGLATLLRGLKGYSDNITAIVAMADNGGSSGRLREELGVAPPGDLRHCLTALAGEEELLTRLFSYRFKGGTTLLGHSFGNLFLTAMADLTGDLEAAIRASSRVLAVRGQVLPATLVPLELVATLEDGRIVRGESQITASGGRIREVRCEPAEPAALPEALRTLNEADAIIIGPGSLYTSLAPNLLIPEIAQAIQASPAPKLYVCNVMTQPGETDQHTVADHVRVLQRLAGGNLFGHVLVNEDLPQRLLEKYQARGQYPVVLDREECQALGVEIVGAHLLDEGDLVRHNPEALAKAVVEWLLTGRKHKGGWRLNFPAEAELSAKTRGWL